MCNIVGLKRHNSCLFVFCVSGSPLAPLPTLWSRPRQPVSARTMDRVPQGETDVSFI